MRTVSIRPTAVESGQISAERLHSLDALRAFALLLGVVFHSTLSFVFPPNGTWAVGTYDTVMPLWWFIYYVHSFRMELFFLLAGFFGCMAVQKRGAGAYLKDRGHRILLVFVIALFPMKYLCAAIWIWGGIHTGWLKLPPEVAALPIWRIAWESTWTERGDRFALTHLWFLYYLAWVLGLFIILRSLFLHLVTTSLILGMHRIFHLGAQSTLAPLWLAFIVLTPILFMPGFDVATPDHGLKLNLPVLSFYTLFFAAGWLLHSQQATLKSFSSRWVPMMICSLTISIVGWWLSKLLITGADMGSTILWGSRLTLVLTIATSCIAWIGFFVAVLSHHSRAIRYIADSSYWIYILHLPVVVGLQVWLAEWQSVWLKLLAINVISFLFLFASYHTLVRYTWIGHWLNGPRK